jgi:hypothetical protein
VNKSLGQLHEGLKKIITALLTDIEGAGGMDLLCIVCVSASAMLCFEFQSAIFFFFIVCI